MFDEPYADYHSTGGVKYSQVQIVCAARHKTDGCSKVV